MSSIHCLINSKQYSKLLHVLVAHTGYEIHANERTHEVLLVTNDLTNIPHLNVPAEILVHDDAGRLTDVYTEVI